MMCRDAPIQMLNFRYGGSWEEVGAAALTTPLRSGRRKTDRGVSGSTCMCFVRRYTP